MRERESDEFQYYNHIMLHWLCIEHAQKYMWQKFKNSNKIPDRTTMSLAERPTEPNKLIRLVREAVMAGSTLLFAAARRADWESLLPTFTSQCGPPSYNFIYIRNIQKINYLCIWFILIIKYNYRSKEKLTLTTESRAAMATISAQDTTPGHMASTVVLISSITSNPLKLLLLKGEVFSPTNDEVSSRSTDPSQPYQLYYSEYRFELCCFVLLL